MKAAKNNKITVRNLIFIALFLCPVFSITITGKVMDSKSNDVLIGANVIIKETYDGSATDVDGQYLIKNLYPGEYTIIVNYIGYEIKEIPITISDEEETYNQNIFLEPSSIQLQETKVLAKKRQDKITEAPATIQIVGAKQIEKSASPNLGAYLQGLKGVDFTASGVNNYSLSIRGFNSSFSTRLLMLTDGRVANVPALRVINFSTIPISSEDVEQMEVILGPATSLYGANAHSGVINITSKSPSDSEGFSASYSGTNDERELTKFSARYAKKINDKLSFKVSGSHFRAYEWPFISEREYKVHSNPWVPFDRDNDGKDNAPIGGGFVGGLHPWNSSINIAPAGENHKGVLIYESPNPDWDGSRYIMIGNGEANHGDLDGDGVAGEDWFNGYDDDGDGLVDEDYWWADGIDNFEPWTDSNGNGEFDFVDCNDNQTICEGDVGWLPSLGNGVHDGAEIFIDSNLNGVWDGDEYLIDNNGDGIWNAGESSECFEDWNSNGSYDGENDIVDEYIDEAGDLWHDGYDNNGNGLIDESAEKKTTDDVWPSNWADAMEIRNILSNAGRANKYYSNGTRNPWYIEGAAGNSTNIYGTHQYNEDLIALEFDVFEFDFGNDQVPGDYWFDNFGDDINQIGEAMSSTGQWYDYGMDGFKYYENYDDILDSEIIAQVGGHYAVWEYFNSSTLEMEYLPIVNGFNNSNEPIYILLTGPDSGEGDGIWQPGDTWNDSNQNYIPETDYDESWEFIYNMFTGSGHYRIGYEDPNDTSTWYYELVSEIDFTDEFELTNGITLDVWPPPNGYYDSNDFIGDCGQDGYCWDFSPDANQEVQYAYDIWGSPVYEEDGVTNLLIYGPDYGENDGLTPLDENDYDSVMDLGDGIYGMLPEPFIDENNNGIWDCDNGCEPYTDTDGDGNYDLGDWHPDFALVEDTNNDGTKDYPDFEVLNNKVEVRVDYDPSNDLNFSFQSGYSYSKTQQVTGVGRYLADGWITQYYQLRGRYKNWFTQFFINTNNSGGTRGYNLGDKIIDKSYNMGFQIQNVFNIPKINTEIIWGIDYMKTKPNTEGTVLNDGPNGYDDDGDGWVYTLDAIDQDGDGVPNPLNPYGDTDPDEDIYGIDEDGEWYDDIEANEIGLYFQTKTKIFGSEKWELVTSARIDHHDQLDEGLLFAPKFGITYKPNQLSTFRMSYGKAYNTPTVTALYTNLYFGSFNGGFFDMVLRGNKDGTPYARANDFSMHQPIYYDSNGEIVKLGGTDLDACLPNCLPYTQRTQGAPLFYNWGYGYPDDYIPLDTTTHRIFIPSAYGDGVDYTAEQSMDLADIDPLKSEQLQSIELGYKGFVTEKILLSTEFYFTTYEDFFSPATFITPLVKDAGGGIVGMIPTTTAGTNEPWATSWNGEDDDLDWSGGSGFSYIDVDDIPCLNANVYPCGGNINVDYAQLQEDIANGSVDMSNNGDWADYFGWTATDLDEDGYFDDPELGEWGYVDWIQVQNGNVMDTLGYTIFHPHEVLQSGSAAFVVNPQYDTPTDMGIAFMDWQDVGVDEANIQTNGAFLEAEWITGPNGEPMRGIVNTLPLITLSSLNYGRVYHSGLDLGLTYFFSEKFAIDANFTWFKSTDYYNELTKTYDPINAPKFKFNLAANLDSKFGTIMSKLRFVDEFEWADGIWAGTIGPYYILDLHYNYPITKNIKLGVSATNLLDDMHKELIGGAKMGRQVIMRITTTF